MGKIEGIRHKFEDGMTEIGDAKIYKFEFDKDKADLLNLEFMIAEKPSWLHHEPGKYVSLLINGAVMMSDTPMERTTNQKFVDAAKGRVLVAGLGLGMVIPALLAKEEVKEIVVVEKNRNVISLVAYRYRDAKVKVVQGDIFQYVPTGMFDTIWFDIWNDMSPRNTPYMHKLHKRYKRWLNKDGWMDSWVREYCEQMSAHEKQLEILLRSVVGKDKCKQILETLNER